jgi:hypothetical protein
LLDGIGSRQVATRETPSSVNHIAQNIRLNGRITQEDFVHYAHVCCEDTDSSYLRIVSYRADN